MRTQPRSHRAARRALTLALLAGACSPSGGDAGGPQEPGPAATLPAGRVGGLVDALAAIRSEPRADAARREEEAAIVAAILSAWDPAAGAVPTAPPPDLADAVVFALLDPREAGRIPDEALARAGAAAQRNPGGAGQRHLDLVRDLRRSHGLMASEEGEEEAVGILAGLGLRLAEAPDARDPVSRLQRLVVARRLLDRSIDYFRMDDAPRAVALEKALVALDPGHARAEAHAGILHLEAGLHEEALRHLRSALPRVRPGEPSWYIHAHIARACLALEREAEALESALEAERLASDAGADCSHRLAAEASPHVREFSWYAELAVTRAGILLALRRPGAEAVLAEADRRLRGALAFGPVRGVPYLVGAKLRRLEGRYDEALSLLNAVGGLPIRNRLERMDGEGLRFLPHTAEAQACLLRAGILRSRGDGAGVAREESTFRSIIGRREILAGGRGLRAAWERCAEAPR